MINFEIKWLLSKPLYRTCTALLPVVASNKNTYYRMSIVADINISQGSGATHVRCGGIFKYDYVANILLSLTVKEF